MALTAPTINQLTYEGNPGSYYLEYTGVATGVIYRAYCSPLSTVSKTVYTALKRFIGPTGATAGSIILDNLPDWPKFYVVMTASDVNDANESAESSSANVAISA